MSRLLPPELHEKAVKDLLKRPSLLITITTEETEAHVLPWWRRALNHLSHRWWNLRTSVGGG